MAEPPRFAEVIAVLVRVEAPFQHVRSMCGALGTLPWAARWACPGVNQ
jgi:hypothetical protein